MSNIPGYFPFIIPQPAAAALDLEYANRLVQCPACDGECVNRCGNDCVQCCASGEVSVRRVAIVAVDPKRVADHARYQREENDRRDSATPRLCAAVLMAMEETRYNLVRRVAKALGGDFLAESLLPDLTPPASYTEMRNFLIGELDAEYYTACRAAFARAVMHSREDRFARKVRDLWDGGRYPRHERGWL